MAGDGPENPRKYKLVVQPTISGEAIDIHGDNTTGRTRMLATANWQLLTIEQTPRLVTQGYAQTLDGYTNTYEQYFAQTLNMESTMGRIAQTLGEQITQQVATWFKTHSTPADVPNNQPKALYPSPNLIPDSDQGTPMEQEGPDAVPNMATGRAPIDTNF
jgi:LPS-assembly lipoprotein